MEFFVNIFPLDKTSRSVAKVAFIRRPYELMNVYQSESNDVL